MSFASTLFVAGSFLLFLAERMFGGNDALRYGLDGLGVLLVLMALGSRARTLSTHRAATTRALLFYGVALTSGVFYVLQLRDVIGSLGLEKETTEHARVALQCAIPLFWLIGVLPAIALDQTLTASPHSVHPLRTRTALEGGLAVALGITMLFPANYLANELNKRWDFGFFKTTEVGGATRQVVDNLVEPVRVVLFFPPESEVLREVRPYFEDLASDNLTVETMDAVMDPEQAKQWKVRDNGNIAFIKGESSQVLKLTDKIDTARKDLRKLDSKVQTTLLKLVKEKKTVYFTVGHGEMYWKNAPGEEDNADNLKKGLESLNFKVKELGLDDGLAQAVPDDAALVVIAGPTAPFLPEEVAALAAFRDRGGDALVFLRPTDTPDPALTHVYGVDFDGTPILSDKAYLRKTGGPGDQLYLVTNKYSSHESITELSKASQQAVIIAPNAGSLSEAKEHPGKVQITVKSMGDWYGDTNGNFTFDDGTEKRGGHDLAAVASGPGADGSEWRAAIVASTAMASNAFLNPALIQKGVANVVYVFSSIGWLTNDPSIGGETESEEDVKITHTKEGEAWVFYGTSVLVPAMVMLAGVLNVRRRRNKGAA